MTNKSIVEGIVPNILEPFLNAGLLMASCKFWEVVILGAMVMRKPRVLFWDEIQAPSGAKAMKHGFLEMN